MTQQNKDISKKIKDFLNLPTGWHYGDGVAPSEAIVKEALRIAYEAQKSGFEFVDAVPGIFGEIQIIAYQGTFRLEATINNDYKINLILENNDTEIFYLQNIDVFETISKIQYWGHLWPLISTFFTQNTTFIETKGFQALHLNLPQATQESQLSIKDVLNKAKKERFVNTLDISTQLLRATPHSFGSSSPKSSLQGATSDTNKAILEMIAMQTSMA